MKRREFTPCSSSAYPNITAAMQRRGWKEARICKVLGENWMCLFGEVWS